MTSEQNNVASLLRDSVTRNPDRIAFFTADDEVTFSSFWARIERFSGGLAARGFKRGDRALLMLPMSIELYVALLAVFKSGGIAVFVDPWVTMRTMARLASTSNLTAYLGTPKSHLLRLFERELRRIPIAPIFVSSLEKSAPLKGVTAVARDERALITFTTGSSGLPKGVNRTHRILRAQHERLAHEFPSQPDDVDLCSFPVFALNNLALGVTTLIPPINLRRIADADADVVARVARERGVTTMSASPPLFDRLAELQQRDASAMPTIRRLLTGGAPVTDAQLRRWTAAFPEAEIGVAYGSSEAEPVAHISAEARLSAVNDIRPLAPGYLAGSLADEVRAKVIAIDGGVSDELPAGEIGELIVSGDHVCRDYDGAGADEATRENKVRDAEDTVWHRMGDTGYFDREGRFWIAGRVHSTIRREHDVLHPQLIEQAARGDDTRIRNVAAVGIGNRAIVVIETDDDVTSDVGTRLTNAGLVCDAIVITHDPLPVDPRHNSKIDYGAVKKWLSERGMGGV
jgi:olefin beta-lactone synthetase